MILGSVLTKILQRVNDLRAILHFIKDDKSLFLHNLLPTCQHQILQDTVNIFGSLEELLVFFVFIKVKISSIFIITFAELFKNPRLSYLTHTFKNQRFAVGRILPFQQLVHNKSFHKITSHTFIGVFVIEHHIFIICQNLKKHNLYMLLTLV